ncbi:hypothetical protein [Phaeodactylibacter xiamenensis]|uniref:hypothetical protein n=1 Tax=Phaeodactylibacter xiamenensis TaxID=1524460 RepID=UPI0024A823ED|nr:hypothetical protein [Phaeodactylibacter xiamenensis]
MRFLTIICSLSFVLFGCNMGHEAPDATTSNATPVQTAAFTFADQDPGLSEYWYQGKAEISRYDLEQNRYQDVHPGEAVAIFVTEDFLTDKQVKNDNYNNPNSTPVLKTNLLRKFPTGIYDYSIMTSVFTPTKVKDYPQTLKVSTTAQDWCGHAYMQLNYEEEQYRMQLHSYFENEADQDKKVGYAMLEDELFNRIRIHPEGLPTGQIEIIPATTVIRLRHFPFKAYTANATHGDYSGTDFEGSNLKVYTLEYPELQRTLSIVYQAESPYIIEGWKDTYPSAFDRQPRTTLARRTNTILSPYWKLNSREDMPERQRLDMEVFPGKAED